MPAQPPTIYVIAGCNSAGKTTFARQFLPKEVKCLRFPNADGIARGLSPLKRSRRGHHAFATDIRGCFTRSLVPLGNDYLALATRRAVRDSRGLPAKPLAISGSTGKCPRLAYAD